MSDEGCTIPATKIDPRVLKNGIGVRKWFTTASLSSSVRGDSEALFRQLVSTLNLDELEDRLTQYVESYFSWMKKVTSCQERTRVLMLRMRENDRALMKETDEALKHRLLEKERSLKQMDKINDIAQNLAVSEMDRLEHVIRLLFNHTAGASAGAANPSKKVHCGDPTCMFNHDE